MSKRAVCVGIDAYSGRNRLSGCVNDAKLWAQTLTDIGFEPPQLVTDDNATYEGILAALNGLISGATPGDVLVFQYAGHGTQVDDLDGDEGEDDSKDESLCPIDMDQGRFLIDDDLWDSLQRLQDGVSLTFICDCCHSGSNTRAVGVRPSAGGAGGKRRYIRATDEMNDSHKKFRKKMGVNRVQRPSEQMKWVSYSACQPHEVAWEHNGQGDFTRHATSVIEGGIAGMTNEHFWKRVVHAFGANPAQRPYLDCKENALSQVMFAKATDRAAVLSGVASAAPTGGNEVADFLGALARLLRAKST